MKQKLTATVIALIAIISSNAQNVGIGTITPMAQLSVGSASQFQVNSSGNLIRINNVPYTFPSVQGAANQILKNDGSGNLIWSDVPSMARPIVRIFSLVAIGFTWAIDNASDYNSGSNINPILVLHRGFTYQFNVNAPGHPFRIAITDLGLPYTVGITNNDVQIGVLTFTVPVDAPATLFYYCIPHGAMFGMKGVINIL